MLKNPNTYSTPSRPIRFFEQHMLAIFPLFTWQPAIYMWGWHAFKYLDTWVKFFLHNWWCVFWKWKHYAKQPHANNDNLAYQGLKKMITKTTTTTHINPLSMQLWRFSWWSLWYSTCHIIIIDDINLITSLYMKSKNISLTWPNWIRNTKMRFLKTLKIIAFKIMVRVVITKQITKICIWNNLQIDNISFELLVFLYIWHGDLEWFST
jgi:hypothetical protein